MVVSIKADKHTPMSTINEVKMALRRAGSFTINYSAKEKGE
jgi:biopolymer transport protein ExbD